jgi:hypothetical protein
VIFRLDRSGCIILNRYRYLRINARVGSVNCASTVTSHVNQFPADTILYQEMELIYIFLVLFGGW